MNTKKILNALGIVLLSAIISLAVATSTPKTPSVGGTFHPVLEDFAGGISVNGTTVITSAGAWQGSGTLFTSPATLTDTLTVGEDGTGHNVTFYGDTSGKSFLWNQALDKAVITGDMSVSAAFTMGSGGSIALNTNKFTVAASSGNTVIAGTLTLGSGSDIAVNTNKFTVAASSGNTLIAGTLNLTGALSASSSLKSSSASAGVGYATGAGCAITQGTNRTTGVTCTGVSGAITLVSGAGSATPASFTVTDTSVAATDVVHISQKSGTDLYEVFVTAVADGSFQVTYFTTGGTTTEQPVFNFAVIKAVAS